VKVEVRLFATLVRYRRGAASGEPFRVELANGAALADLLVKLAVPSKEVHLTLVDGRIVHSMDVRLLAGARVGLFPPIGGG